MLAHFKRLCLPKHKWTDLNETVKNAITPLRTRIFQRDPTLPLATSCAAVWNLTRETLLADDEVKRQVYAPPPQKYRSHRSAALVKLAQKKKDLEKNRFRSPADHDNFLKAVRAHINLNKKLTERKKSNLLRANEGKFKRDKCTFAKELLQESPERAEPTFD